MHTNWKNIEEVGGSQDKVQNVTKRKQSNYIKMYKINHRRLMGIGMNLSNFGIYVVFAVYAGHLPMAMLSSS